MQSELERAWKQKSGASETVRCPEAKILEVATVRVKVAAFKIGMDALSFHPGIEPQRLFDIFHLELAAEKLEPADNIELDGESF